MSERRNWVDVAKGIGISLVVYGHVARGVVSAQHGVDHPWLQTLDAMIYSFHMPLFFFLSGLFFYRSIDQKGWRALLSDKTRSILYPYVVWSVLQGSMEVALASYTNGSISLASVLAFPWSPRAQFWFLYVLFLVFLISAVSYPGAAGSDRKRFCIGSALTLAILYLLKDRIELGRVFDLVASNFVFFAFGVLVAQYLPRCLEFLRLSFIGISGAFVALQCLVGTYGAKPGPTWFALLVALVSILFVVALSVRIGEGLPWLKRLGAASMAIYLMHIFAGSGVRILLWKGFGIDSVPVHLVVGTIAGLTLPLLADRAIRRLGWNFLYAPPRLFPTERKLLPESTN